MKYSYLLLLLLLQACVYELPETVRQPPNEEDLEDKPTNTLVIVDYYNPNPVVIQEEQPISEVVIDYHPENINTEEAITNNNSEPIQPVDQTVVETIPVIQEPIIVLLVSPEIEITTHVTPVVEIENIPPPVAIPEPVSVVPVVETVVTPETVETIAEPEIQETVLEATPVQEESPVIASPEPVVQTIEAAVNSPEVSPVKEELKKEEPVVLVNPIIEAPVYPQIPLISSNLIPAETKQIVSLFVFYASLFNKNIDSSKLIIEIETAPSSFYIAYCSKVNNNQNPKIKMNRQVWGSLTSSYREMLLFHELGHCLLNRSHQGNDFYNPTSIMNASLFSDLNYKTNYDYFIKELFGYNTNVTEPILFGALYEHIH